MRRGSQKADLKIRILRGVLVGLLLGTIVAGIMLAEVALHPERKTEYSRATAEQEAARFGAKLEETTLTVPDGSSLRAWFMKPAKKPNGSIVILLHGVSDNRDGMVGFAPMFLDAGYAVLLPDARAHGESGGKMATYGLLETDDIKRWVDWMNYAHHPKCVYGFGESLGAALLLQSLAAHPKYCAVVAESSFDTFRQAAIDRLASKIGIPRFLAAAIAMPVVQVSFWYARLRYHLDFSNASPADALAHSDVPALLIHGAGDSNIPPAHSERLQARRAYQTDLWIVPRAEHTGAMATQPGEFRSRVLSWFSDHTSPRP